MDGSSAPLVAGLELGGTKCVCTLARGNEIVAQQTVPTTLPHETLPAIEGVLDGWWAEQQFEALGVASFGPVDLDPASPTYGSITATAKAGWRDANVLLPFARKFAVPNAIDTDVNGAALSETMWGAGRGATDFAYITVGTGVGVGLVANGMTVHGFSHPELGHIRIPRLAGDTWPGSCPYHGDCVEGLASGTAIVRRLGERDVGTVPAEDPVWETVAHAIAQLCHVLVCASAPQRIAVGGGVISKQPHLLPRIGPMLRESLAGYLHLPAGDDYVSRPGLGDSAGPLGSIALALAALASA
jgi:fructokinase